MRCTAPGRLQPRCRDTRRSSGEARLPGRAGTRGAAGGPIHPRRRPNARFRRAAPLQAPGREERGSGGRQVRSGARRHPLPSPARSPPRPGPAARNPRHVPAGAEPAAPPRARYRPWRPQSADSAPAARSPLPAAVPEAVYQLPAWLASRQSTRLDILEPEPPMVFGGDAGGRARPRRRRRRRRCSPSSSPGTARAPRAEAALPGRRGPGARGRAGSREGDAGTELEAAAANSAPAGGGARREGGRGRSWVWPHSAPVD